MNQITVSEHFTDSDVLKIIKGEFIPKTQIYELCVGVLIKAYSGSKRVSKRGLIIPPIYEATVTEFDCIPIETTEDSDANRLRKVIYHYIKDEDIVFLEKYYPLSSQLYYTAYELVRKMVTLSAKLMPEYLNQPIYPRNTNGLLQFHEKFINKVIEYHNYVRRPEGTYDSESMTKNNDNIIKLANLNRFICPNCQSRRQIYCGSCGGIRSIEAEEYFPPRIELPFNVLLLVHWQDSLHKCTGIHTAVLCQSNQFEYQHWTRPAQGGDVCQIIESFDPLTDVLLFPCEDAISANDFQWNINSNINTDTTFDLNVHSNISNLPSKKHRLIVLESSWNAAKTMANQIKNYRKEHNLQPIVCVILEDIIGQYWRFHNEGNSAVSTIEAIGHTAVAAGMNEEEMEKILLLFKVQKYRVLVRIEEGKKPPQAVAVEGSGIGSWNHLIVIANPI